jgi:hypothetical protein
VHLSFERYERSLARKVRHYFEQRAGRQDACTGGEGGLRRIALRKDERASGRARREGHRERPAHGAQLASERKLAGEFLPLERGQGELAARREDAHRDRQVEAAGVLRQLGGREIHRDAARRKFEVRMVERCAHAVARLAHLGVGQANDMERRQPRAEVHLHGHLGRVDAGKRAARHRSNRHEATQRLRALPRLLARFQIGDARLELA